MLESGWPRQVREYNPCLLGYSLPKRGHSDDPAICFAVDDRLSYMCTGGECEQDREEVCGANVGTETPELVLFGEINSYSRILLA